MKKYLLIVTAMLLLAPALVSAQRVKLTDGDVDALRGVKKLNVKYDYSDMTVGKKPEKEYVDEKTVDYNKKEDGKGDKWAQTWVDDREGRFEPRFEDEFQKQSDIVLGSFPHEKYTLIIKTTRTEPGYNIGITRKSAAVDVEAWIVETANQSHVIAKISAENCPGNTMYGADFDTGERIQDAYGMAGRGIARYISGHM